MSASAAELAALRATYAALDPSLGPVAQDVGGATVFAVRAWPDHPWAGRVVMGDDGDGELAVARLLALGITAPYVSAPAGVAPPSGFDVALRLLRLEAPTGGAVPDGVEATSDADEVVGVCRAGFAVSGEVVQWRRGARPGAAT